MQLEKNNTEKLMFMDTVSILSLEISVFLVITIWIQQYFFAHSVYVNNERSLIVRDNHTEMAEAAEDTMHGRFLTFCVGQEVFGIEIRVVKEIIGLQHINTLPEVPAYIRGVINLRGRVIPVIDMRLKLKKEEADYTDRTCIIVIETQQISAGLIVDQVAEVLSIGEENICPPPELGKGVSSRYINGIGKVDGQVKLLLDCEMLFDSEETVIISKYNEGESK